MTDIENSDSEIRELTPTETGGVAGGSISMVGISVAVVRFLDDINFRFYGCVPNDQGGQKCVYSYDAWD